MSASDERLAPSRKPVRRGALLASMLAIALLSSCASRAVLPSNPLAVIGDGASWYAIFPTAQNRPLTGLLFAGIEGGESMLKAADRTEMVYAGGFDAGFRAVARGSFPQNALSIVFPKSKGWAKLSSVESGFWYRSGAVDVAIPAGNVALLSSDAGIEEMLRNLRAPSQALSGVDPSFAEYASIVPQDGRISVYIRDASVLTARVLGPDIALPIDYAIIYATPKKALVETSEISYELLVSVVMKDARSAKAMASLMRLTQPQIDITLDGTKLSISGVELPSETLVEFARNMYFKDK